MYRVKLAGSKTEEGSGPISQGKDQLTVLGRCESQDGRLRIGERADVWRGQGNTNHPVTQPPQLLEEFLPHTERQKSPFLLGPAHRQFPLLTNETNGSSHQDGAGKENGRQKEKGTLTVVSSWHGRAPDESGGSPLLSRDQSQSKAGSAGVCHQIVQARRTLIVPPPSAGSPLIIQSSAWPPVEAEKTILLPSGDQSMWRFWASSVSTPVRTS